ncbi:MAG TPA: cytochrome c [Candidatus Angelobacter sp.]|nr:cytochrome c [Candidatus Angelobacter sp.]
MNLRQSRRTYAIVWMVLAAGVTLAAFGVYGRHSNDVSAALRDPGLAPTETLKHLMKQKLHTEYTFLSFTIAHDPPLTPEKMDAIASSSARITALAENDMKGYVHDYQKREWSEQDAIFFWEKRLQLSRASSELSQAAGKHDPQQVVSSFQRLDGACQACHERFRADIPWI